MALTNWKLEGSEVVALPLDELALLVLRNVKEVNAWNWDHWLMHAKFTYHAQWEVLRALGEAWGWLQNHGLISWHPEKDEPTAFVVSRRGEQLLKDGLP